MMSKIDTKGYFRSLIEKYRSTIPTDLRAILLPNEAEMLQLAIAIKRLRVIEEERYYVSEIQQRYGIPLRPNETVKRTMIRVRLDILSKRREADREGFVLDIDGPLPTDPLE